jgi:hypothetical protein
MTDAIKETKAQRAERLKAALNPWSAYAEIERFAREGWGFAHRLVTDLESRLPTRRRRLNSTTTQELFDFR